MWLTLVKYFGQM